MQPSLSESLAKTSKGAGIIFLGYLVGLLFTFLTRLIVARYGTEGDYGIFSLAYTVLSICGAIALLGLAEGASRSIGYYRGKNEDTKVGGIISSSIWLTVAASVTLFLVLFLASGIISRSFFHDPALILPLKLFAIALPFSTLIHILASIFRGFDRAGPTAFFHHILRNALFLILLLPVIFFRVSFDGVFYVHLAALIITWWQRSKTEPNAVLK